MSKREFLQKLKEYLSYELPESYVDSNVRYYSDYIDNEVKNGRKRDEVLEDLGDPQLIARTIIDAAKAGSDGIPNTADDRDFSGEIYGQGGSSSKAPGFGQGQDAGGYDSAINGTYGSSGYGDSGRFDGADGDDAQGNDSRDNAGPHIFTYTGNGCLLSLLFILILVGVVSLLSSALAFLSPIIAPLCLILLIVWLWNRRR